MRKPTIIISKLTYFLNDEQDRELETKHMNRDDAVSTNKSYMHMSHPSRMSVIYFISTPCLLLSASEVAPSSLLLCTSLNNSSALYVRCTVYR